MKKPLLLQGCIRASRCARSPEPPVSSALTARQFGQPTASLVRLGVAVTTGMRIGNAG